MAKATAIGPAAEGETIMAAFTAADENGDGVLENAELRELVAGTGGSALDSSAEIDAAAKRMMQALDANADRKLSRSDVMLHWKRLGSLLTVSEVAEWVLHSVQLAPDVAERFRANMVTGYDFPELVADNGALLESDVGIEKARDRKKLLRSMEWKLWGMGQEPRAAEGVTVDEPRGCDSLAVRWEPPAADSDGFPVHKYVLRRRVGGAGGADRVPSLSDFEPGSVMPEVGDWTIVMDAPGNRFRDVNLSPGTLYTYSLQAWNALGHSEAVYFQAVTARTCDAASPQVNGSRSADRVVVLPFSSGTAKQATVAALVVVTTLALRLRLRRRQKQQGNSSNSSRGSSDVTGGSSSSNRNGGGAVIGIGAEPPLQHRTGGGSSGSGTRPRPPNALANVGRDASSQWLMARRAQATGDASFKFSAAENPSKSRSSSPVPYALPGGGADAAAAASAGPSGASSGNAHAQKNVLLSGRSSVTSSPKSASGNGSESCNTVAFGGHAEQQPGGAAMTLTHQPPHRTISAGSSGSYSGGGSSSGNSPKNSDRAGMSGSRSLSRLTEHFRSNVRRFSAPSEANAAAGAAAAANGPTNGLSGNGAAPAGVVPPFAQQQPPLALPARRASAAEASSNLGNLGTPDLRKIAAKRLLSQQHRSHSRGDESGASSCVVCGREPKWFKVSHTCSRCHRVFCDRHGVSTHVLPGCPVGSGCTCDRCLDSRNLRTSDSI